MLIPWLVDYAQSQATEAGVSVHDLLDAAVTPEDLATFLDQRLDGFQSKADQAAKPLTKKLTAKEKKRIKRQKQKDAVSFYSLNLLAKYCGLHNQAATVFRKCCGLWSSSFSLFLHIFFI